MFGDFFSRVLRNSFLTRLNRKKSQGAKSGEFGGGWMVFIAFCVKKLRIMMALCDGALLWCKNHYEERAKKNAKHKGIHVPTLGISVIMQNSIILKVFFF